MYLNYEIPEFIDSINFSKQSKKKRNIKTHLKEFSEKTINENMDLLDNINKTQFLDAY